MKSKGGIYTFLLLLHNVLSRRIENWLVGRLIWRCLWLHACTVSNVMGIKFYITKGLSYPLDTPDIIRRQRFILRALVTVYR
ncbi:hypothetical protein EDC01DRAFT_651493 [Geopyxis carbonaria]|nr:hypothetical protein EDC01DRAFT_651493 [Geopyxis carbonaria]